MYRSGGNRSAWSRMRFRRRPGWDGPAAGPRGYPGRPV